MPRLVTSPYFFIHAIGVILAISVLSVFARTLPANVETPQVKPLVNIGIEHADPLTVFIEMTMHEKTGIFDVSHDGQETVTISLPTTWQRREVRGAPIDAVTSEDSIFGFSRWSVPPGASLSFTMNDDFPGIAFHNPTLVHLMIDIKKIDIMTGAIDRDVLLVQEVGEKVWED